MNETRDKSVSEGSLINPLGIGTLDHIGVAVVDAEAGIKKYVELWGYELTHREVLDDAGLELIWLEAGDMFVELVRSLRDDTPIANFLKTRGPGLHHIAVRVNDIDAALAQLAARGARLLDEQARPGGRGMRIAFVHPGDGVGVLWELVERTGG